MKLINSIGDDDNQFHLHVDDACRTCALLQAPTKLRIKPKICSASTLEPYLK